jgi:hypothetical protein
VKEDTRKELSNEAEGPLTPQEEAEFFLMVGVLEERHAIDQARKGNTLFLIDYLQREGDPHDRLRDYLLDVLLHKVPVPKPRPAVEKAHREYWRLALQMAVGQFIRGHKSEEATRVLEDSGIDHSKLERARRRYPWHRNEGLAHFYLYGFQKNPAKARAAIEKFCCDNFPIYWTERYRRTGGTK